MDTVQAVSIGDAVRDRRLALGLTQAWLAELAGCSVQSLWLFEGGYVPRGSRALGRVFDELALLEKVGRIVPFEIKEQARGTRGPQAVV
jgi:transcriptional regulator with XRE-family HTH domain